MTIPVTTTFDIQGYRIKEYKGVVRGIIVRAPTIVQGVLGGLKNIIGGNIGAYTEMCEQARLGSGQPWFGHGSPVLRHRGRHPAGRLTAALGSAVMGR